jgi:hypothetical protein
MAGVPVKRAVGALCLIALLAEGCQYASSVAPGREQAVHIRIPDAVDMTWNKFHIHLDPTVLVWADQARVDLRSVVKRSLDHIETSLRGSPTAISIAAGSYWKIPNVGIGGDTNRTTGEVSISMDARRPTPVRQMLTVWLPVALAHELHHSKRIIDGPGYGSTLLDAMVSEGSAEAFVREVYPRAPAIPWVQPLQADQERDVWRRARAVLSAPDEMDLHNRWFLGGGALPKWSGYRLGYAMVRAYLNRHTEASAASLATLPTARIFSESGFVQAIDGGGTPTASR